MKAVLALALCCACAAPRVVVSPPSLPAAPPRAEADPRLAIRDVLRCFVAAVEARDFEAAHALLGRTWRDRVDVARLERDFELEPLAADRVRRLKTQLEAEVSLEGPAATLALGEGASAALALEPEGWRLLRLE